MELSNALFACYIVYSIDLISFPLINSNTSIIIILYVQKFNECNLIKCFSCFCFRSKQKNCLFVVFRMNALAQHCVAPICVLFAIFIILLKWIVRIDCKNVNFYTHTHKICSELERNEHSSSHKECALAILLICFQIIFSF